MSLLTSVLGIWSADLGVDLGTANTLVLVRGRGIVIREPTVLAVDKRTNRVIAAGTEARSMLGRTPQDIEVFQPMRGGVIADFDHADVLLKTLVRRAQRGGWPFDHARLMIAVPSDITEVERRAITDAGLSTGARSVHLVNRPLAAALGAALPVEMAAGCMILDCGAGATEVAVISLGRVMLGRSMRAGGNELDFAIAHRLRRSAGVLVGQRTAEDIKMAMASAFPTEEERSFHVRGRDLATGLPRTVEMTTSEVRETIAPQLMEIVRIVREALTATPVELLEDVMARGLVACGGGSLIPGLAELIEHETHLRVSIAEDPMTCVVRGLGALLEKLDTAGLAPSVSRQPRALRY